MGMLVAQFAFGIPITFGLVYVLIPLYGEASETYRAIIAGALPLVTAIPKVIVRLSAQRIDFLHPGASHVLLNVLFSASAIVFRVMQADLFDITLFTLLSFAHGTIDLPVSFQIYKFIYNGQKALPAITDFFTRVSIAISMDFAFNTLSFWLQMSYLNVAIDRVWKKRWRKHMVIAFIVTALTMLYFAGRLLPIVSAKSSSNSTMSNANCSQLILESWPKKIYFVSLFLSFSPLPSFPLLVIETVFLYNHRNLK